MTVRLPWLEPGRRTVEAELLLSNDRGEPHSGHHFNKVVWHGAFRAVGLDYARRTDGMHALRHFYASTLLAGGVSIKEVAEYSATPTPASRCGPTPTSCRRATLALARQWTRCSGPPQTPLTA